MTCRKKTADGYQLIHDNDIFSIYRLGKKATRPYNTYLLKLNNGIINDWVYWKWKKGDSTGYKHSTLYICGFQTIKYKSMWYVYSGANQNINSENMDWITKHTAITVGIKSVPIQPIHFMLQNVNYCAATQYIYYIIIYTYDTK